jgi:hypothetical protein
MPDPLTLVALAFLFSGGKKKGAAAGDPSGGGAHPNGPDPAARAAADPDGAKLFARANQQAALSWAPIFLDAGATSTSEANALARWAGLESSGNPNPQPPGNGGGLMQVGRGFVDMGALTKTEYARLTTAPKKEEAAIALRYVHWLADQAARLVGGLPPDPIDHVWYAYWYHQRPVDVRDILAPLAKQLSTTSPAMISHAMFGTIKDPATLHRLRAANVVAFDHPEGPA